MDASSVRTGIEGPEGRGVHPTLSLSERSFNSMSRPDQRLSETDIRLAGAVVAMIRADEDDSRA